MTIRNTARGSSDYVAFVVLGLLCEAPRHPYDLQRVMRERHKDFAADRTRALYRAVERLARDGLIEAVETNREGRRPERTVYAATEYGREEFESWLLELLERPAVEWPALLIAIDMVAYLPPLAIAEALQGRTVSLESAIGGIDAAQRALRENLAMPRVITLELELARALRQAELDWVRSVIADLRSGALAWDLPGLTAYFQVQEGHSG
jgi:DNA-binding PadR family transcriptional regulator